MSEYDPWRTEALGEISLEDRAKNLLDVAGYILDRLTNPSVGQDSSLLYASADLLFLTSKKLDSEQRTDLKALIIDNNLDDLSRQPGLWLRNAREVRLKRSGSGMSFSVQLEPVPALSVKRTLKWYEDGGRKLTPLIPNMIELAQIDNKISLGGLSLEEFEQTEQMVDGSVTVLSRLEKLAIVMSNTLVDL